MNEAPTAATLHRGPWRHVSEACVGDICDIRVRDPLGSRDALGQFFLHDDGHWYRVNPPTQIAGRVVAFRVHLQSEGG